jgi:hypothetical protein
MPKSCERFTYRHGDDNYITLLHQATVCKPSSSPGSSQLNDLDRGVPTGWIIQLIGSE